MMSRSLVMVVGSLWLSVLAFLGVRGLPTPIERAQTKAAEYAAVFNVSRRIEVVVVDRAAMPQANDGVIVAHTTRTADGLGCRLHFNDSAVKDLETVAHEVCHCALDWMVIDGIGYIRGLSPGSTEFFEKRAYRCAKWLVDPRLEAEIQRREGRMPTEVVGR